MATTGISQKLKDALSKDIVSYYREIELYPRYWDAGEAKYKLAENPLDITCEIKNATAVKWKLDNEGYNIWNLSNVSLAFRNEKNQWKEGNPDGYFPQGYIAHKSKIVIKTGAILEDDSKESGYVFTGYIENDPLFAFEDKEARITIVGRMKTLEGVDAELLSIPYTAQVLGSGEGNEFSLPHTAVGIITEVKRGKTADGRDCASALIEGKNFTVSGLNVKTEAPVIKLTNALLPDETVWASYRQWHTDKSINWIVEETVKLAGISDYQIEQVEFDNIRNIVTIDTKEKWEEGDFATTKYIDDENCVTARELDNLDFPQEWYRESNDSVLTTTLVPNNDAFYRASQQAYGTWDIVYNHSANLVAGINSPDKYVIDFYPVWDNTASSGYAVSIPSVVNGSCGKLKLYEVKNGVKTLLWQDSADAMTTDNHIRISRDTDGNFRIYIGAYGSSVRGGQIIATDNEITSCAGMRFAHPEQATNFIVAAIRTGPYPSSDGMGALHPQGVYETKVIDSGAENPIWGFITANQYIPAGTEVIIETAVSEDGEIFGGWTQVSPAGAILSASRKYIKARWRAFTNISQTISPSITSFEITYSTEAAVIPMVNLSAMNCRQTVEELAAMCAYETGFDASDKFIFRPRQKFTGVAGAVDAGNISRVSKISNGVDRVYNRIKVSCGNFNYTADCANQGQTAPTSEDKYGARRYSISGGNLLPSENVDLAYSIAPAVWNYTNTPRRRCSITAKYALHYELGDIVSLTLSDNDAVKLWKWGQIDAKYGGFLHYSGLDSARGWLNFHETQMRIEGIEFDIENWQTQFDLVEAIN